MEPTSITPKSKSRIKIFSLIFTIQTSLVISLITNILFIFVLFSVESLFKMVGIILHTCVIGFILLSLRNIIFVNTKTSSRLGFLQRSYTLLLTFLLIFYIVLISLLFKSNVDINSILFFVFSTLISGIFHLLLVIAINSFITQNGNRPTLSTSKNIDEDFKEILMRSSPM